MLNVIKNLLGSKEEPKQSQSKPAQTTPPNMKKSDAEIKQIINTLTRGGSERQFLVSSASLTVHTYACLEELILAMCQLNQNLQTIYQSNKAIEKENQSLRQSIEQLSKIVASQEQQIKQLKEQNQNLQLATRQQIQTLTNKMQEETKSIDQAFEQLVKEMCEYQDTVKELLKNSEQKPIHQEPVNSEPQEPMKKFSEASGNEALNNSITDIVKKPIPQEPPVDVKEPVKKIGRPSKVTPEIVERIKALDQEGKSLRDIEAIIGVSYGTVKNILKKEAEENPEDSEDSKEKIRSDIAESEIGAMRQEWQMKKEERDKIVKKLKDMGGLKGGF